MVMDIEHMVIKCFLCQSTFHDISKESTLDFPYILISILYSIHKIHWKQSPEKVLLHLMII